MTHAIQDMITLSNPMRLAREVWQESDDHPYSVRGVLTTPNGDCPFCSVSVCSTGLSFVMVLKAGSGRPVAGFRVIADKKACWTSGVYRDVGLLGAH